MIVARNGFQRIRIELQRVRYVTESEKRTVVLDDVDACFAAQVQTIYDFFLTRRCRTEEQFALIVHAR